MKSMFHMVGCLLTAMVFSASADTLIENYRYGTDSGSGELNFRKIRDALERINYNGWVAVESGFQSDVEHGKILKRFAAGEPICPK